MWVKNSLEEHTQSGSTLNWKYILIRISHKSTLNLTQCSMTELTTAGQVRTNAQLYTCFLKQTRETILARDSYLYDRKYNSSWSR